MLTIGLQVSPTLQFMVAPHPVIPNAKMVKATPNNTNLGWIQIENAVRIANTIVTKHCISPLFLWLVLYRIIPYSGENPRKSTFFTLLHQF